MKVKFMELAKFRRKPKSKKDILPDKFIRPLEALGKKTKRKRLPKKIISPMESL